MKLLHCVCVHLLNDHKSGTFRFVSDSQEAVDSQKDDNRGLRRLPLRAVRTTVSTENESS